MKKQAPKNSLVKINQKLVFSGKNQIKMKIIREMILLNKQRPTIKILKETKMMR